MAQRLIPYKVRHLLLAAAMWAAVALLLPPVVSAQEGPNRAALVVRFADGSLETHCVSFSEPFISGMELLTRSGLQVQVDANSGLGGAVCRLQEFGCAYPVQDCFCRCQGAECEYWAYYHWLDGGWQPGTNLCRRSAPVATGSPMAHWRAGRGGRATSPAALNRHSSLLTRCVPWQRSRLCLQSRPLRRLRAARVRSVLSLPRSCMRRKMRLPTPSRFSLCRQRPHTRRRCLAMPRTFCCCWCWPAWRCGW